ncbi:hypothetical protein J2S00_000233 [Caldalkalibacillus uzonensis]|uniref:Uncharacterized protein n=1 Tax=Caldalkalibacillus uzonensis TaxID=353224 RepID=A0ABU0CM22_9BACI|nr:hypothetical protein [Caldalkalibacillus uzonensis]MDQ0337463.1 hypothetical protein [Caldalkalibacillus uzonensis]
MSRYVACMLTIVWVITSLVIGVVAAQQPANIDLEKLTAKVPNAQALVDQADLIVYGTPREEPKQEPTNQKVNDGELVIFYQSFEVKEVIHGPGSRRVEIVRPGVEPLPPPEDPINLVYPGPLADSVDYVLFLKQCDTTRHYYVVGVWQGVYPLDPQGRTIALLEEGFPTFHGLTVEEMKRKINQLQS